MGVDDPAVLRMRALLAELGFDGRYSCLRILEDGRVEVREEQAGQVRSEIFPGEVFLRARGGTDER